MLALCYYGLNRFDEKEVITLKIYKYIPSSCLFLSFILAVSCKDSATPKTAESTTTAAFETAATPAAEDTKTQEPIETENETTPEPTASKTADNTAEDEPRLTLSKNDDFTFSVWWWDAGKALNLKSRSRYLDFLEYNGINEIYFCPGDYSDEKTAEFVKSAGERGISCLWLTGDASWLKEGNDGAENSVERFLNYQKNALMMRNSSVCTLISSRTRTRFFRNRALYMQNSFLCKRNNKRTQNKVILRI